MTRNYTRKKHTT